MEQLVFWKKNSRKCLKALKTIFKFCIKNLPLNFFDFYKYTIASFNLHLRSPKLGSVLLRYQLLFAKQNPAPIKTITATEYHLAS